MSTPQNNLSSREQMRTMKLNALKILGISVLVAALIIGSALFFPIPVSIALLSFTFIAAIASIFLLNKDNKTPQKPRGSGLAAAEYTTFEDTYDSSPSPSSAPRRFFDITAVESTPVPKVPSMDVVADTNTFPKSY